MKPSHMPRGQQISLLTSLYAAQGLPFGFFTLALPVLLRESGWSLTQIGYLQFLALPWALKFLWAPAIDHHGSRKMWLMLFQWSACLMALLLAGMSLHVGDWRLLAAVLVFNLIAATQDIVTDGLAVRMLDGKDRGLANAIQVGAYRLGMILGGGWLLWLFAKTSWATMFLCMAGLLALTIVPVLFFKDLPRREPSPEAVAVPQGAKLLWAWLHRALSPGMLAFAALVFAYRFGDQVVSSLINPFMIDQGVSKEDIAIMKGAVGSSTALLGAALGGWMMLRFSRRQALLFSGLTQACAFALYVLAAMGLGGVGMLWAATLTEGVFSTLASVSLFALMMDASDPDHAGTDFTLLASFVNVVGAVAGVIAGFLGDHLGYVWTFSIGTALAVGGCLILVGWLDRRPTHARVAQAWR